MCFRLSSHPQGTDLVGQRYGFFALHLLSVPWENGSYGGEEIVEKVCVLTVVRPVEEFVDEVNGDAS
jgi:hypothetical protein